MYFTENRYDRSIEWMMKGVPNFYARSSGIVVTGKFEYTAEMTTYIYPQNLRAKANLWLWSLRDFLIMGIAALLSVVILVQTHIFLPAAATLLYGFLSIRLDDTTIIDYLRYAVKFFISTQQHFEWR